ncbi:MAG: hypothetical protein HYX78_02025 [Armatimonadetes bacterium]|nr:hypothetical protein [Armatimonadota bacterium]
MASEIITDERIAVEWQDGDNHARTGSTSARTVHVVAHTHWDREWYLTFQQFRINLVRLIDRLIAIMQDEEYKYFLLDGQAIIMEDYLEVHPERKAELADLVRNGRISVGPWYVLPDLFLVSGESIIRNLQIGRRLAEDFGEAMPVGYMPDQFGFPSQMPQILAGFGIRNAVVWRGFDSKVPTEAWWESPDGSRVLIHKLEGKFGYLNAAELKVESPEEARVQVVEATERIGRTALTSQFLLMNGVDHRFPNPNLPRTMDALDGTVDGTSVVQSSLPRYFEAVRHEMVDLPVVRGEQRKSQEMEMLQGTLSTRMYLKQENERTETSLAYKAEPLCAFAWLMGAEYPRALLNAAWKELIKNHAHDSICGCSLDEVHREMMTRFSSARQIAEMLSEYASKNIADALSGRSELSRTPHLLIFNTLPWERTELIEAEVQVPRDEAWEQFSLFDGERYVPYTVLAENKDFVSFNAAESLDNFPVFDDCHSYTVRLLVENVPGWGYKALEVRPGRGAAAKGKLITNFTTNDGLPGAETDCVRLSFNRNGTFDVLDLRSGLSYTGLHYFEDSGDRGDEYNYCPPDDDQIVTSSQYEAAVSLESKGEAFRVYRVEYEIDTPECLIREAKSRRSDRQCALKIVSFVALAAGVPRVDITTVVENNVRDHRMRVLFPTDIIADVSFSETVFDIVERDMAVGYVGGWMEDPLPTRPQLTFAGASSPGKSLVIANRGLTEYELCADDRRTFALTLLRCVEWGSRGDLSNTRRGHREDGSKGRNYMFTPDAQCQGIHQFHYSVIPCAGDIIAAKSIRQAYNHKVDMVVHQRKLAPTVDKSGAFIRATVSDPLIPSALKVAEQDDMLIARMVNLSADAAELKLMLDQNIESADLLDLDERPWERSAVGVDGRTVAAELPPKAVRTLGVRPAFNCGD